MWAGAMVTLYGSIISFINLLFGYINYVFPDVLYGYYGNPYDNGLSYWMAAFIILSVAAVGLLRYIHTTIAHDPSRADIWVRRWALYLTLFIAGLTILGDLITLLNAFLAGEDLTTRFLLKVLVVLLVAGGVFMHFLADLRGYWAAKPARANAVTVAVGLVGIIAIVSGFFIIGTPWDARVARLDNQRVSDLESLQGQILSFYQNKQALPNTLTQLEDPTLYYNIPVDPETGAAYEYTKTADLGFELCATFKAEGRSMNYGRSISTPVPVGYGVKGTADNWQHGIGRTCFVRSVDPDFFPPFNKTAPVR
ncbi:MAG: Uncharacterized protein G01um101456_642 [Parcubacteria group bacterium Gr01-1014_56]|nr:MAG: Uncharacterized protein G01um101456_642 [Parcubacteria group bacterium Gr01-1014_56]